MALVENGLPLNQYCRKHDLTIKEKVGCIITCADALSYLHANLVIHRDLKPDNVLVNGSGVIKIVDFGIAKLIEESQKNTNNTTLAFTPKYAAPEQFNGGMVSTKTDVYSLGVIALELLVDAKRPKGKRPFDKFRNDEATIAGLLKSLNVDKDLKNILSKALRIEPEYRYETMNAFASDLSAWLADKPVSVTVNTIMYKTVKFAQRRTALFFLSVFSLTSLILMVLILNHQNNSISLERQKAIDIKNFMLDLFASADPEKNGDGQLKAIDLLNIASVQAVEKQHLDQTTKSEILSNIGSAFVNLGSAYDGEALLLEALEYDPENIDTKLKLIDFYIGASQLPKSTKLIALLDAMNLPDSDTNRLTLNMLKAWSSYKDGRLTNAIQMAQQAKSDFAKLNDLKGLLRSTEILGLALVAAGQHDLAIQHMAEVVEKINQSEIKDRVGYIKLLKLLGVTHRNTGDHPQALMVNDEALLNIKKYLGNNHPLFITISVEKARTLSSLNRYSEAFLAAQQAQNTATQMYGTDSKLNQHAIYGLMHV